MARPNFRRTRQPFVRTVVPHGPSRCRIEFARRCPSESHQPLPQFPREPDWLLIPRRWVSCVLPRIRRSPCETESAAMKRGCKGTVALVPLTIRRGRVGGARWDDWRTGCPLPRSAQRRERGASSPGAAVAAKPTERSRAAAALRPTCHRAQRMARRSSRCEHFNAFRFQRPGSGLGG